MGNENATDDYQDPLLERARNIVNRTNKLCVARLQRELMIGYNRALRLMEAMIEEGLVERYSAVHGIGYRAVRKSGELASK